jgi:hypothetical protein
MSSKYIYQKRFFMNNHTMVPCAICGKNPIPCSHMCDDCQEARGFKLTPDQIKKANEILTQLREATPEEQALLMQPNLFSDAPSATI